MRNLILRAALVLPFALLGLVASADAQTATQSVTVEVDSVNVISVSNDPGTLTINSATAGSSLDGATDNSTTWSVTTNLSSQKLVASVGTTMPTGVTLNLAAGAPTGGSEVAGGADLTTSDQDLVTGISNLNESGLTLTYTASATTAADPATSDATKTVSLTVMSGA